MREAGQGIDALCERFGLRKLQLTGNYFTSRSQAMAEVMIPPTSQLIGKTVVQARFRSEYDLAVRGLKRRQTAHEGCVLSEKLKLGDTLLVVGPGNYSFFDVVRIGGPFTLVVLVTTVLLVPLVFPFSP